MSVINKMLRDLDDRVRSGTAAAGYDAALSPSLTQGTTSVSPIPVPVRAMRAQAAMRRRVAASVLALGMLALLGWLAARPASDTEVASAAKPPEAASARPIAIETPRHAAVATAAPASEAVAQDQSPRSSVSSVAPLRGLAAGSAVTASDAVTRERTGPAARSGADAARNAVLTAVPVGPAQAAAAQSGAAPVQSGAAPVQSGAAPAQSGAAPAQSGAAPAQSGAAPVQSGAAPVRLPSSPADGVAAPERARARMPSAAAPSGQDAVKAVIRGTTLAAPPPDAAPPVEAWHEQAVDVLALAQRRWNGGETGAAMALLRRALAARAVLPDQPEGADFRVAQAMVRELVRMESALGNQEQVLAVLRQYEALVLTQADLWAVRAQAAQRLTQHAQAVRAYRAALQLRPAEPRWMLGLAVSLGALGQVQEAGRWLERAHAIAPVDREVMDFLAQLQVRLANRSTLEHGEQTINKR